MIVCVKRPSGDTFQKIEGQTFLEVAKKVQQSFVRASIATIYQLCIHDDEGMYVVLQVKYGVPQDIAWKKTRPFCELILLVEDEIIPVHSYFSQKLRKCKSSAAVLSSPTTIPLKRRKTQHDDVILAAQGLTREYPWKDIKMEKAWRLSSEKSIF